MTATRHLVIVASAESSTTDALADRLRESCAVRTGYTTADVLDRLDDEVDVVVVDPELGTATVSVVQDAISCRDLSCQVGLLTEDASVADVPAGIDTVIPPSAGDQRLRDTVEWLAMRATYRKTLDEYYDLTLASADLQTDESAEVTAELDRLHNQLDHLRERLDETAAELDTVSLFEAALGRPWED